MRDVAAIPAEPPPELAYRRPMRLLAFGRELLASGELIRSLAERQVRPRYAQAALGFAWAILTPLALMVVFTVFFQRVAEVETGDVPYALFAYVGLISWTFFSSSVSLAGTSLVNNVPLLNKVYCPREAFPASSLLAASVDVVAAMVALVPLFALAGFTPRGTSAWVPVLLMVQVAFTLGVAFLLSIAIVYLRDLRHALPIILQVGLFATPVAYRLDQVPDWARPWYAGLNPLGPVIDGYRRTVLYGQHPEWDLLGIAAASALALCVGGYLVFKRFEPGITDVA